MRLRVWLSLAAIAALGAPVWWWLAASNSKLGGASRAEPREAWAQSQPTQQTARSAALAPGAGAAPPLPIAKTVATPALSHTLNLLLIGIDQRPGSSGGGRPDTIIVLSFSERQGHVGLISVPRDLYVEIPGYGFDRINATFGVARRQGHEPTELLKRVVQDTLKVPIQHSALIDLNGFEEAIDAIGGVDVHVPCAIADNFIDPRAADRRRRLDVEPGVRHMDGKTAAMYVRSRHGRSDWSRARRQQAVLLGLKQRMLTVAGLLRLPALLQKLGRSIHTDMTPAAVLDLAARLARLDPEHVHGLVIGFGETEGYLTPDGKAVLLPDQEAIEKKIGALFAAKAPGSLPEHARCADKDVALEHRPPVAKRTESPELGQGGVSSEG